MVSAISASWFPKCYKKSDAHRGSPDMIERAFEDSFGVRGSEFEEDDQWQRPQGSDAWA